MLDDSPTGWIHDENDVSRTHRDARYNCIPLDGYNKNGNVVYNNFHPEREVPLPPRQTWALLTFLVLVAILRKVVRVGHRLLMMLSLFGVFSGLQRPGKSDGYMSLAEF